MTSDPPRATSWPTLLAGLVCAFAPLGAPALAADTATGNAAAGGERPARGLRMDQVEQRFGAPSTRHAAVGQPPITRWDYPGLIVFFEHDRVVHAVLVGPPAA